MKENVKGKIQAILRRAQNAKIRSQDFAARPGLKTSNVAGTRRMGLSSHGKAPVENDAVTVQWRKVGFCWEQSGLKEQKT